MRMYVCLIVVVVVLITLNIVNGYRHTSFIKAFRNKSYPVAVSSICKLNAISADDSSLYDALTKTSTTSTTTKLDIETVFTAFATNEYFVKNIWQKKPYVYTSVVQQLVDGFTMNDVKEATEKDFLEAGRGSYDPSSNTGWSVASVSTPRGTSFEDAKLRYEDIENALKQTSGTVVLNSAGGFIPKLADVCLQAVNAFQFPTALNLYITNPGQVISAPPHTDKQDVFVMQTQGQKRWRVYGPPPTARMPRADPFARGKGKDALELTELSKEPLVDVVLSPGQILYIPGGYPHTTDTVNTGSTSAASTTSVHMTVGIDTRVWSLDYAALRRIALSRAGIDDKVTVTKLSDDKYWDLQSALPLGFLLSNRVDDGSQVASTDYLNQVKVEIITNLIKKMRIIEPSMYNEKISDLAIIEKLQLNELLTRILLHHENITDIFGRMYADVSMKITPAKMDLSFFRSQVRDHIYT